MRKKFIFGAVILAIVGMTTLACGSSKVKTDTSVTNTTVETPKEWVKIVELSGEDVASDTFALQGGQQKIEYNVAQDTSGYDLQFCFIYITREGYTEGFWEANFDEAGSGETIIRKSAGEYYLHIVGSPNCSVVLYERR